MALDERLNKVARIGHNLTQPVPGARGGEGGDEGGGTAETVISSGPVGSRKLTPNEQGHTKPFVLASGTTLDDMTGYVYHGIRVDNFTPQFMRVHGLIDAYIPPNTYGVQIPVMMGSQKCWVTWEAPVGYTQPAAAVTQSAIIYFTEALISPSAGIDINGLAVGAADLRVNIDQIAGAAVAAATAGILPIIIQSASGANQANVFSAVDGLGSAGGLVVDSMGYAFGGSTFDRVREMGTAADGLGVILASQPSSAPTTATGNNANAVITHTGVAGQRFRITSVSFGYTAVAPTAATLTCTATDATSSQVWQVTGLNSLQAPPMPPGGIKFAVNTNVTVTLLASGAAGSIGNVNDSVLVT